MVVELAWDLPTDHVVTMDMRMSSASIESNKFLKATEAVSNLFRALLAKDLGKSGVLPKQHSPFDCDTYICYHWSRYQTLCVQDI